MRACKHMHTHATHTRTCTYAATEDRGLGVLWSRDQPSGSVPLVPSLLLPSHGGRLEAGQMATVVREAIARWAALHSRAARVLPGRACAGMRQGKRWAGWPLARVPHRAQN